MNAKGNTTELELDLGTPTVVEYDEEWKLEMPGVNEQTLAEWEKLNEAYQKQNAE